MKISDEEYTCDCMKNNDSSFLDKACGVIEQYLQTAMQNHAMCPALGMTVLARVFGSMSYDAVESAEHREGYFKYLEEQITVGRVHAEKMLAGEEGHRVDH